MTDMSAAASGAAATTTTTSPAASQPAASPAPATTAATTAAAPETASPVSEATPRKTADQILDEALKSATKPDTGAEPDTEEAPKELTSDTDPAEEQKADAEKEGQEEQAGAEEVPEHYKGVFAKHPELRMAFFRDKAFRDLKLNVKEARELRQTFPTLADARLASEDAAALVQLTRDYERDPSSIIPILEGNAASFERLQGAIVERIGADPAQAYRANPEAFRPLVEYAGDLFIGNLRALAESGDAEAGAVADFLADRQGSRETRRQEKPTPTKEQQELDAYRQRDTETARANMKAFVDSAKAESTRALTSKLEDAIAKRDPNGLFSPRTRSRMAAEALKEVQNVVKANGQYRTQLPDVARSMKAQDVVAHVLKYADISIPGIVEKVVAAEREEALKHNRQTLERLDKLAPAPAPATPANPSQQRRHMSHEEKVEAVFARNGLG